MPGRTSGGGSEPPLRKSFFDDGLLRAMSQPPRQQFTARVHQNTAVCRDHWRLVLRVVHFPATSAGQFIQILCADPPDLVPAEPGVDCTTGSLPERYSFEFAQPRALLRRPFSLAGRRDHAEEAEL